MEISRTKSDRTPIRRAALWTADKDRRRKLFRAVRELTGEDPWGITDSPLADDGTLLRKTRPRGKVEFFLSEPTAEELIAELSAVRRTRAFTVVTVLNGDETSRYTRVLVDPRQVDPVDDPADSDLAEDSRVVLYEDEYAQAVAAAHKAMSSSYIGRPPPELRGDADRMVAALRVLGWTPPGEATVEHGLLMSGGGVHVRADGLEDVYPLAEWIKHEKRDGAHVMRRKVIVVEDWSEIG